MKNLLFVIFVTAFGINSNAQKLKEADVPATVKENFKKQFPSATNVLWGKEDANFEAEFKLNGKETSALIDATGNLKETEVEIPVSQLSKPITDYCTKNYSDYKISEASKITNADNIITYEAELKKGKEHFDVIFSSEGNFLKKIGSQNQNKEDKD